MSSFKSSENIQKKEGGSAIQNKFTSVCILSSFLPPPGSVQDTSNSSD